MPDRVVRQKILSSDLVNTLTWPAEVFYRRLMSITDDYGRHEADTALLRAFLYPKKIDKVSEPDVVKWLGECSKAGLVRCYHVDGKEYLEILQFGQRLRAMKSKCPPPPSSADSRRQMSADCSNVPPETKRNESESETETESKGKGGEPPAPAPPAPPSQEKGGKLKEKQVDMLRRRKEFHTDVQTFSSQFLPDMLGAFFTYWTEPNKSETKMRFEMEATWQLSLRLATWEKKDYQFKQVKGQGGPPPDRNATAEEVEYLYQRFLEGAKLKEIAKEKHCDFLLQAGLIELDERFVQQAALWRAKQLEGTNDAGEQRMIAAYQSGTWPADPDCKRDEVNRTRIAKKLALIDYFKKSKNLNKKTITDADEKP